MFLASLRSTIVQIRVDRLAVEGLPRLLLVVTRGVHGALHIILEWYMAL